MNLNLFKTINEHFSFKLFIAFGTMASLIALFFTGYYVFHQSRSLNTAMIKNGMFQAEMLAHNSRIGVFSENEALLDVPVGAISQQNEVLEVLVFSAEGLLLKRYEKTEKGSVNEPDDRNEAVTAGILEKIREAMQPTYHDDRDGLEFWVPVLTKTKDVLSESLGFDELPLREEELIGFVMIRISKENFTEQLKKLLLMSVIILVLFLVAAFFASYFIAKRISKPLNRLIDSVHTVEMGMDTEKVPVGTRDEIGLLAEAFNDMTESLKKREDDLKALNSALLMQDKERKALSKRLIDLLEKDREHVAMELHDHIGQTLTSLKINLEIMQGQLDPGHSSLEASLKSSRERAVQALRDIKQISRGLKPSVLDALGLVSSLRELLNEVKINTGINFKFFTHRIPEKFGKEKELAIYRITQEALNNIIKHANAGTVFISLVEKDGKISLSIEDDGVGFELEKTMEFTDGRGYLGLLIMRERAEQLRGEFNIESKAGKGTLLLVEIPI